MFLSARNLRHLCLAYVSRPAHDRLIYRAIRQQPARTIVELGIGDGRRAERMIELAAAADGPKSVRYTAIDPFELRRQEQRPGISLKQAYRQLRSTGASVQVVPGDPLPALARVANSLTGTDLLLISADQDRQSLEAAWFYVPRMLHPRSRVFVEAIGERPGVARWRLLPAAEIRQLAARHDLHRRAA